MNRYVRAVAVLCATAAVTVSAPAANAARDVRVDGTGDVWAATIDSSSGAEATPARSTEQVNVDVTKAVVTHGGAAVKVSAAYVDLRKTADVIDFAVRLRDENGRTYWLHVEAGAGFRGGMASLYTGRGRRIACDGLSRAIDYAADTITVQAPRRCLDRPRWIQYQAAASLWRMNDDTGSSVTHLVDDARSGKAEPTRWSARIRRG